MKKHTEMEKAIFQEPGSQIRLDLAPDKPANAWHLHEAPEWETQCQEWSLFMDVEDIALDWRCGHPGNWCNCSMESECGYSIAL